MAKQNNSTFSNLRDVKTNVANTGMNKDLSPELLKEGQYTHAINAKLNNHNGNFTFIQNEPSTLECIDLEHTYLSEIPLLDGKFVIFSGGGNTSEIGIFDSKNCTYTTKLKDPCLNFHRSYPPSGVYQQIRNCDDIIYFVDHYNPDRYLNLNDIPYITIPGPDDCDPPQDTQAIDCDKLRLRPVVTFPKIDISLSQSGGKLSNAAYQVAIAYSEKGVRITDIHSVTQPLSIFSHQNFGGGIDVILDDIDKDFDEYILYLIQTTSNDVTSGSGGVPTVYELGVYTTYQDRVHVGNVNELSTIPYEDTFLQSVHYEKSKKIVSVDDRALIIGPISRPRINYQPLANDIRARWVAKTVNKDYYKNGGKDKGNMREEVYPYGIQWKYNTGEYTEAFHIPGRFANPVDKVFVRNEDVYEIHEEYCDDGVNYKFNWEVYNTARGAVTKEPVDNCEEIIIGSGLASYWESLETYPNNEEVYGSLACKPIRHHKMPDINSVPYETESGNRIILGMEFSNISPPVDCDGNVIPDIVGYRIVRGDRTNHKSIQGKGLLYNMSEYDIPDSSSKGYYPNYPYNDLREDKFLRNVITTQRDNEYDSSKYSVSTFKKDVFTFHSPNFDGFNQRHSFGTDLFIEAECSGTCHTKYDKTYEHPKNVIITDLGFILSAAFGILTGIKQSKDDDSTIIKQLLSGGVSKIVDTLGNIVQIPVYSYINTKLALTAIQNMAKERDFTVQVNSVAKYDKFKSYVRNKFSHRRRIVDASYMYPITQTFDNKTVNNLYRESGVMLKLNEPIIDPSVKDNTRQTMQDADNGNACDTRRNTSTASSHYASIRRKLPSQYGQIDSIRYLDTGYYDTIGNDTSITTGPVFGGDTFLTTYTLKRKMQYFTQTASGNEDGYNFDYSLYPNIPYPRYWMDTFPYDPSELLSFDFDGKLNLPSVNNNLTCDSTNNAIAGSTWKENLKTIIEAGDEAGLTKRGSQKMYLSNNGIVSFVVESEFNLDLRDWDDREGYRHYDEKEHTDLNYIFRQDFKTIDNNPLYNSAYSKQLVENYIQPSDRDFTCTDESRCYTNYDNRVIYSLQYQEGGQVDNWRSFLANNYYDFPKEAGNLLATKPLDRNNIAFLFDNSAPWITTAQDTLQTDSGNKVTIGDGGLFAQRPRPIIVTDTKYGAASHSKAITHTQYGLFYPSADQGRIYVLNGTKLDEINVNGMNWWLKENMPFNITSIEGAPTDSKDIGFVSVFDNKDEVYYLTKRDYTPVVDGITYDPTDDKFIYNGKKTIAVSDTRYFTDCSWTISYLPKMKAFISFHDWHPESTIQTQGSPLTVKDSIIYKHNETCEHYCHFYKQQYSFDVEFVVNNMQQTSSLSSIEYSLECYKYFNDCKDSHHLLDYNFNRAFIHNTEQTSGMLHLNLASKNDITKVTFYPKVRTDYIDIEFSKVEQKYRFNQFWDVTKNRAEFNDTYVSLLSTECNTYKYVPNPDYINYNKPLYQRKKIRHNWNKIYLSRVDSPLEMNKMILKFTNSKEIVSPR